MARGWLVAPLGALALASCSADTEHVTWPAATPDMYFVLKVSGATLLETHGPILEAAAAAPSPLHSELQAGEDLLFLGLSIEDLRARQPHVDSRRLSEARIETARPSCEEASVEEDKWLRLALEHTSHEMQKLSSAGTWELAPSNPEFLRGVSLRLPYDDNRPCLGDPWRLEPFAAERQAVPEGAIIEGAARSRMVRDDAHRYFNWAAIAFLDASNIVAASGDRLLFFERDAPFSERGVFQLPPPFTPAPGVDVVLKDMKRDPTYSTAGQTRLLGVYESQARSPHPGGPKGAIREFIVDNEGLLSVRTTTVTLTGLQRLAIDGEGRFVVGGENGYVVTGHVDRGVEDTYVLPEMDLNVDAVLVHDDAAHPFLVISDASRVFGISPDGGREASRVLGPDLMIVSASSVALWSRVDGSSEIWMSTFARGLRKRAAGVWSEFSIPLPSRAANCAGTERVCGRLQLGRPTLSMVPLPDGRLALTPDVCSGLVLLSADGACSEVLPLGGGDQIGALDRLPRSKHARLGELVALAGDGEIVVLGL